MRRISLLGHMASPHVSELLDQTDALAKARAEINGRIAKAKQADKRAKRAAKNAWAITEHMRLVAIIAYMLARGLPEPECKHLAARGLERQWPTRNDFRVGGASGDSSWRTARLSWPY